MAEVKYTNSFPGIDYRFKLRWNPGEIKKVSEEIAKELIKNKDFIIVSDDKKVKKKSVKEVKEDE